MGSCACWPGTKLSIICDFCILSTGCPQKNFLNLNLNFWTSCTFMLFLSVMAQMQRRRRLVATTWSRTPPWSVRWWLGNVPKIAAVSGVTLYPPRSCSYLYKEALKINPNSKPFNGFKTPTELNFCNKTFSLLNSYSFEFLKINFVTIEIHFNFLDITH